MRRAPLPDHLLSISGYRSRRRAVCPAEPGNIYTRITNPTNDAFERRVAALQGGKAALATASGQFAETLTVLSLCNAGDEFISTSALYGGTFTLFSHSLRQLGITARFIECANPARIEALINDRTRLIYLETIGNPKLEIPDFATISEIAHAHGLPVVCDNTFATPYLFGAFEHGVDIVSFTPPPNGSGDTA